MPRPGKVEVENVMQSGKSYRVDAARYGAMKEAVLTVLPASAPGMTVAELGKAMLPHLSQEQFPGGAASGWWLKCVQLDLEAKGVVRRTKTSPLRLHRA